MTYRQFELLTFALAIWTVLALANVRRALPAAGSLANVGTLKKGWQP